MTPEPLVDSFGRRIDYLRLSVTDRCNLRCVYCLPASGYRPAPDLLTDDQIVRVVGSFVQLGVNKVRVTGGEPLVRPAVVSLVDRLNQIQGMRDVSMSTNGLLLRERAMELKAAGLSRINVSLDSLRPERFREITRSGSLSRVLEGLQAALAAGLDPVKVNVVVMRGVNDDEIPEFVRLTYRLPLHVRFIELMPIGETGFFSRDRWLPLAEIRARCGALEPVESPAGFGPASYEKPPGALGTVGFIGALSCNFCGRCNRLRLTAKGELFPCLASDIGVDLGLPLRRGAGDAEIGSLIRRAVALKPERHRMEEAESRVRESFMCALGG